LLDVKSSILIEYHYEIANARAVLVLTNKPAEEPTADPHNSEAYGDVK
jgi:hypothetical protein